MARVTSIQGQVEVQTSEGRGWRTADLDDVLCLGSVIRVGALSRAALVFTDDSTLRLDQSTTLIIREREAERRTWLEMLTGAIHFFSHRPRALGVETPFVNAAAEGTEFLIRVGEAEAHILMYEGAVLASNPAGELRLGPDDAALIREGEKPIPEIVVRPRDAVAWAVHYPPVLSVLEDRGAPGAYPAQVKNALEWLDEGNYRYALRSLDQVPAEARSAQNETLRAGIFLNIGRVEEAEAAIERALAIDADFADAYAQRSIIHVVRNERAQALRDADRAVQFSNSSSTALIAQSYARQASFDLEGARQSLRDAVDKNPNDALAYARLAEIELSFADYDRANDAADQAVSLAPDLARTQTVRGFSNLAEIDTDAARASFAKAIDLYSADPLPHLGQGLAKIRDGFLEDGRRDLEIAASLDPNNALIRSYLGKAYFEEKRAPKDATQFDIAKKLDPNDPTPWFYDAIRKQTENRPVEALRDLEKAIELNDNRAVYRSSLLLDQDLAARGASLALIYNDLGFEIPATNEASKSLDRDPGNYSAHRFLSDAYAQVPRHEIARVSELLQAQLLQPINTNPIRPSLIDADISVTSNIESTGSTFNEYNALFERENVGILASGTLGSNSTLSDEVILFGLVNKTSFSAGQFHDESNGFRQNNDSEEDIDNVFLQAAISKKLNLQAEFRNRKGDQGDLNLNFNSDNFSRDERRAFRDDVIRFGLTYSPSANSRFLSSLIYNDASENVEDIDRGLGRSLDAKDEGFDAQSQYILNTGKVRVLIGGGYSDIDFSDTTSLDFTELLGESCPAGEPFFGICDFSTKTKFKQENAHIYTYGNLGQILDWTLGLSYDSIDKNPIDLDRISPKVGVRWKLSPRASARLAYIRTLKRGLVADRTLEPTQVSGFAQFFDDVDGTIIERIGLGLDVDIRKNLYAGLELSRRDLDVPLPDIGTNNVTFEEESENLYRSYLHWNLDQRWTATAELKYQRFTNSEAFAVGTLVPNQVNELSLPLKLKYFSPSGIFGEVGVSYVYQDVKFSESLPFNDDNDHFSLVDVGFGKRLPNRNGILKLEVRNLFDENFRYQDTNIVRQRPVRSSIVPERQILLNFIIKF